MKEKKSEFIVVADKNGEAVGVIDRGAIGSGISEGITADTPIFRLMISPPVTININAPVGEAFSLFNKSGAGCLIVGSEKNKTEGILSPAILSSAFSTAPDLIISGIASAASAEELHGIFLKSRMLAVSMILGHADPFSVTRFISSVADAICRRVIDLCLAQSSDPPCRFAFIQAGSAGRLEQTLCTDQDNAIIFENREGEELVSASSYFLDLASLINKMLSETGYKLCKGENMASNPKWCQPVDRWKKYFSDWIRMPGPEELLDVSIFFDFRHCYGDQELTAGLREYVNGDLGKNDIFFHHMAAGWKQFSKSRPFSPDGVTDIKKLMMPLTGIIRLYALKHASDKTSTVERILSLYAGGKIGYTVLRDTLKAWKDLTTVRLRHQAASVISGTEPGNIIDFRIDDGNMRLFAEQSSAAIDNLMLLADSDFYTSTI